MIEPPIIPAREALGRVLDAIAPGYADMTAAGSLPLRDGVKAVERAAKFLRTACARGTLALIVIGPHTGDRHALPAAFFERPDCRFAFHRRAFLITDLDERDSLYLTLRPYDGWAIGFIEPEFHAWLVAGAVSPVRASNRSRKATKKDAVIAYVQTNHPGVIPPGVTYKVIARANNTSERTVRRALSGK